MHDNKITKETLMTSTSGRRFALKAIALTFAATPLMAAAQEYPKRGLTGCFSGQEGRASEDQDAHGATLRR